LDPLFSGTVKKGVKIGVHFRRPYGAILESGFLTQKFGVLKKGSKNGSFFRSLFGAPKNRFFSVLAKKGVKNSHIALSSGGPLAGTPQKVVQKVAKKGVKNGSKSGISEHLFSPLSVISSDFGSKNGSKNESKMGSLGQVLDRFSLPG
jgi:hypothetical protein